MTNFVKISRQMKKFSIQELDTDRSVCMAAIYNSGPVTDFPLGEKDVAEICCRSISQKLRD